MKYLVRKSVVHVVGQIWMPGITAGQTYDLDSYALGNARDDEGKLTRESVQRWLDTHAGDFSSVTDFWASLEDDNGETVEIPWQDEESEVTFNGCMFPEDDD